MEGDNVSENGHGVIMTLEKFSADYEKSTKPSTYNVFLLYAFYYHDSRVGFQARLHLLSRCMGKRKKFKEVQNSSNSRKNLTTIFC